VARGGGEAAGGEDERRDRVDARAEPAWTLDRSRQEDEPGRIIEKPLHQAQRAGILAFEVLQEIAEGQEPGAGRSPCGCQLPERQLRNPHCNLDVIMGQADGSSLQQDNSDASVPHKFSHFHGGPAIAPGHHLGIDFIAQVLNLSRIPIAAHLCHL